MFEIKGLLKDAVRRAKQTPQMEAVAVLNAVQPFLKKLLPSGREDDVAAQSYRFGELRIVCNNSAAAQLIRDHEEAIRAQMHEHLPGIPLRRIRILFGRPSPTSDL